MLDGGNLVLGRKRNMKNNIPEGMFSSIVTEVLEEELGISKEAYDEANRLFEIIKALIACKSEYKNYFINDVRVWGIQRKGDIEIFNGEFIVNYWFEFIFVKDNEELETLNYSISTEQLGYDQENNLLIIRMPIFTNGTTIVKMDNLTEKDLNDTLHHEFKHIYQKYMLSKKDENRMLQSFKDSKVYQKVTQWISTHNYDGSKLSNMFWAIYYLEPTEITANLQMLYGEIKSNAKDKDTALDILSDSDFIDELITYSNLLDELINNKIKLSDLMAVEMRIGRNKEWLIKYIRKGVNKMKQSIRKIEKLIDKEYPN
jgi:hypothetical protein